MDRVDVETNRYLDSQVAAQEADEEVIQAMEDAMFEQSETLFDALDNMSNDTQNDLLRLAKAFKEIDLDAEDDYMSLKSYSEVAGMVFLTAIEVHVRETVEMQLNK